jgi:hypothetical protein
MANKSAVPLSRLENHFFERLKAKRKETPVVTQSTWYFSVSMGELQNGAPLARLRRYEEKDTLLQPSAEARIAGKVVGDVKFADGKAHFGGNGHIEFHVTAAHTQSLDETKLEPMFLAPKPLSMIVSGEAAREGLSDQTFANPLVFYRTGQSEFGLFATDGALTSKINLEILRAATGQASIGGPAVWNAYIAQSFKRPTKGKRFAYVHEISNGASLKTSNTREFYLYEPFLMALRPGSVFYVGNAPIPGATPFHGWIDEVIIDPSGSGSGGGGGGGGG